MQVNQPAKNAIIVKFSGDGFRRTISFEDREIFYEFDGDIKPGMVSDADAAAVSLVYYAMRRKRPLHIEGRVSSKLLENLEEFQRAWHLFRPDLFHIVDITVDEEVSATARPNSAVIAYSGGIDANSSLVWQMRAAGRRKRDIQAAVLAHGLDAKLTDDFGPAIKLARQSLEAFGIPLTVVRTNWRSHVGDWEMTFIGGIGSILHQFDVGYCLLSSDEDYGSLALPWSSNPVTNPLLSGIRSLQTEGGGFTRCEKARMIADFPDIVERLRVCWKDYVPDRPNCGTCEKCIRTKMNFAVWELNSPECLGQQITARDARRRLARNEVQLNYLREILKTARQNGIDEPWVGALSVGILKSTAAIGARKIRHRVKKVFHK